MRFCLSVGARARIGAFAVILLAPASALANGPLAVCESGRPFLWPSGGANIPYNPDRGSLGPLTNAQAVALVGDAFRRWDAIPTASTSYLNTGPLPQDVDITNFAPYFAAEAPDGLSAVVFDNTGEIFTLLFGPESGVLGFAGPEWADVTSCTILEGVAFLNGTEFTDTGVALDILVHELGHYQNLGHSVVNGQIGLPGQGGFDDHRGPSPTNIFPVTSLAGRIETMYPFYLGPEAGFSTPHMDDAAGLSRLYPAPSFAASRGAISGLVVGANGRTRLSGVNVVARNIARPFEDAVSAITGELALEFAQNAPFAGAYTIHGLTPGARYAVYVDEILAGDFSVPPLSPLPGAEEFYSGVNETNDRNTDAPSTFVPVRVVAGTTLTDITIILNAFRPGERLPLADDGSVEVLLPFRFEMCGQSFESLFVNANGSVTFGAPDPDFTPSRFEFLDGPPRVAGLWTDLNPALGGEVTFAQTATTFTVSWSGVPEFPIVGSNSFRIRLYRSLDRIDVVYGGMTAGAGIAGVSCGAPGTSRFEQQQDLSVWKPFVVELWSDAAGFELFSPVNPFDLAHSTIQYTGTLDYDDRWAGDNNTIDRAKRLQVPFASSSAIHYTELESGGDVDFFKVRAKAGQVLVAEILTSQIDTLLGVFTASGEPLAIDDQDGAGALSRVLMAVPADGDYVIGVTAYPDFDFVGAADATGRYVLSVQALTGTLLPVFDDESVEVDLGFAFPFEGSRYTSVFVNGNGNLTFGSGDATYSPSIQGLLTGPPRIAGLWHDLFPRRGLVVATREPGAITVQYVSVPGLFSETANNFSIRLDAGGNVTLSYGGVLLDETLVLVGISGGRNGPDPGPANLSRPFRTFPREGTTYELFTADAPFDLPFRRIRFQ